MKVIVNFDSGQPTVLLRRPKLAETIAKFGPPTSIRTNGSRCYLQWVYSTGRYAAIVAESTIGLFLGEIRKVVSVEVKHMNKGDKLLASKGYG